MIDMDSLEGLANDLRKAGVSDASINIAINILKNIGELNPNENLPKSIKDWLRGQASNSGSGNGINFIPSDHKISCQDLLMVVCAGEMDYNLNTMEAIALCINCRHSMKAVIIASDYWIEKEFNKWRKSTFKALQDQFGITFFVFTPVGNRWTVNSLALT